MQGSLLLRKPRTDGRLLRKLAKARIKRRKSDECIKFLYICYGPLNEGRRRTNH
jgi:hypothetical protein